MKKHRIDVNQKSIQIYHPEQCVLNAKAMVLNAKLAT